MGLNLSGPAALCGLKPLSSLSMPSVACLCQAFLDGGWAGMVGWHQSRANLAMTSGQGTFNLWDGWLVLLLYVPSQQLWSLRDGQFT